MWWIICLWKSSTNSFHSGFSFHSQYYDAQPSPNTSSGFCCLWGGSWRKPQTLIQNHSHMAQNRSQATIQLCNALWEFFNQREPQHPQNRIFAWHLGVLLPTVNLSLLLLWLKLPDSDWIWSFSWETQSQIGDTAKLTNQLPFSTQPHTQI